MATRSKKQKRRQRRLDLQAAHASMPDDLLIEDSAATVEVQAASGEGDQAKPPTVKLLAYSGGLLRVDGFPYPVVVDVQTLVANAEQYPLLHLHNSRHGVGHVDPDGLDLADGRTIKASGVISHDNEWSREVLTAHKNGKKWQPSIGVRIDRKQTRVIPAGQTLRANGQTFEGPVIYARGARLGEISFVPRGGDDHATASLAASRSNGEDEMDKELREFIEAAGMNPDELNEQQIDWFKAQMEAGADDDGEDNLNANAGGDGATLGGGADIDQLCTQLRDDLRAEAAAERTRIRGIEELCASFGDPTFKVNGRDVELAVHAISEGWDVDRTELECRRESRPRGPAGFSHSHDGTCTLQALQGAMMLRAGLSIEDELYASRGAVALGMPDWLRQGINDANRNQIMEAAHRYDDMSLVDVCREAVRLDGRSNLHGRTETIQAAFSGGSLANIWTTSVNARVLRSFEDEVDSTRGWVQESEVADFKSNERFRTKKGGRLTRHARGGSADHRTLSDQAETFKIARYSNQFVVDEMDVIDDAFDQLMKAPADMGAAAALLRPDLVYSALLANATMSDGVALFHADHNNLNTSAALSGGDAGSLAAAITAMALQQENGRTLNITPTHIVVPQALVWLARKILRSGETRGADASSENGTTNVMQGAVTMIVSDSRLDNGVTDPTDDTVRAGSATTWYLASARRDTIEVAVRRGTGGVPGIDSWKKQGEDGQWLMGWAVKHDIGCKPIDWLALQKNTA